jgi:hypothetical protein
MKVKVEIVYAAPSQNHDIVVELKGSPKGTRLLNAVEKAVEKHMAELAKETPTANNWRRWNLREVVE